MLLRNANRCKINRVARTAKRKMKNLDFKSNLEMNTQKIKRKQTLQDVSQFQDYLKDSIINNKLINKINKTSR